MHMTAVCNMHVARLSATAGLPGVFHITAQVVRIY